MKASTKILIIGFLFSIIMLFLYYFNMRNAYQKALANPLAEFVKIDLKESKYLNISHHWNVNFKQADKFQIQLLREYKDSLLYKYMGDSLNLDATSAGELTIYVPKLPVLKFKTTQNNSNDGIEILFDKSFKDGALIASINNYVYFKLEGSKFDLVNIKANENIKLEIKASEIKNLSLKLPKHSEIDLNYSNILAQNLNLVDSCSVKVTGNYTNVIPGKYYGTILK